MNCFTHLWQLLLANLQILTKHKLSNFLLNDFLKRHTDPENVAQKGKFKYIL